MSNRQSTKTSSPAEATSGDNNSGGNKTGDTVDKIRDLIFGEQMVGYEERFKALESRLVGEIESLRQTVEDKLAELKVLTEERSDQVEELSVSRKKLGDSLQKLADNIRA